MFNYSAEAKDDFISDVMTEIFQREGRAIQALEGFPMNQLEDEIKEAAPSYGLDLAFWPLQTRLQEAIRTVFTTICAPISVLRSQKANNFQLAIGLFLLGSSASKREMEVLAHAGLLTKAVEALKQQPRSSDKTAFWTAYKTLADEFDKEFQRKYGNDLDTSLIFAGLFSAVSSAFIQIQPELQMHPNTTTQALLGLLVQNITGATAPAALLPPPTGPTTIVVVAQCLLYFSLFSTLLAALLAVLGRQWLLHYDSVGERGTIEERGLERQRKFDGMRRWKFDLVMQMFPLLLHFALLLFATALAIYLWTIHQAIAGIVLGPTMLGFIFYTVMVLSAVAWEDSPFQTSLSFVLKNLLKRIPLLRRFGTRCRNVMETAIGLLGSFWSQTSSAFAGLMKAVKPLLPLFHGAKAGNPAPPQPTPLFHRSPPPSREVSAVIWALETSTDPFMVQGAAGMSCFNGDVVREGFGALEMVTDQREGLAALWTFNQIGHTEDNELRSIAVFMRIENWGRFWYLREQQPQVTQWTLRFIATQHPHAGHLETIFRHFSPEYDSLEDNSLFADFLFCVNSFFSPTMACDRALLDKSISNSPGIVDDILTKVAAFAETRSFPGYIEEMWNSDSFVLHFETQNVEWVYGTLASLHDAQSPDYGLIADLLQALFACPPIHGMPSAASLRLILSSFPVSSAASCDPMRDAIKGLALRVFLEESLWHSLARNNDPRFTILGEKLSNIPGIYLAGLHKTHHSWRQNKSKNFLTVLSRVWDADEAEANQFGDEKTRVMMFTALANAWDRIDFSSLQLHCRRIVELLECTVSTAFSARINWWQTVQHPSQSFTDTIMVRLGDVVARAGERAKQETGRNPGEQDSEAGVVNGVAEFLSRFALCIHGELQNPQQLEKRWIWRGKALGGSTGKMEGRGRCAARNV
ncbi:hypothetical protein B0H14DRAFT_2583039 [Mycena olivaceomarginata]|nr:hypothetical protein B0H14DRAFT_2583039 [Mycena olivaceomarginata]